MNFWKGKRVFITGGNGFIGSWIIRDLLKKGAKIYCLIYEKIPYSIYHIEKLNEKVKEIHGSVQNYSLIFNAITKHKIDVVFHLAASAIVQSANNHPINTFKTNIQGTWNVLEAVRNYGKVKACVIASTDKAYGEHKHLPYSERAALHGEHPYSVSKSSADLISQAYYLTYNLPITITRCGNVYGWGDSHYSRIVPAAIICGILNKTLKLRSDGTFLREYLYVEDIADAYIKLAEKTANDSSIWGQAFNMGEGKPYTVMHVVNKIAKLLGKKINIEYGSHKINEIKAQYLSNKKELKVLKWKPKNTLEQGLRRTIRDYQKNIKLFKNGKGKNKGICFYH